MSIGHVRAVHGGGGGAGDAVGVSNAARPTATATAARRPNLLESFDCRITAPFASANGKTTYHSGRRQQRYSARRGAEPHGRERGRAEHATRSCSSHQRTE